MNKKRLVSMLLVSAMTAALFTGCGSDGNQTSGDSTTSAGTNSTTEEAGIKEFTAFFAVAGSEINDDNEVQQLIAEKVGAKVKETWLTGQTADEAVGTMIAGGEYPDFIEGQTGTDPRGKDSPSGQVFSGRRHSVQNSIDGSRQTNKDGNFHQLSRHAPA